MHCYVNLRFVIDPCAEAQGIFKTTQHNTMKFELPILDFDFVRRNNPCKDAQTYISQAQEQNALMEFTALDVLKMDNIPSEDKIWFLSRKGAMPEGLQRLCAVAFARETPIGGGKTTLSLMGQESVKALNVAKRFAMGSATLQELLAARDDAWDAARGAARGAAWDAAGDAVWSAVWSAARGAARGAAWGAAWDAAWDAVWSAVWSAARSAARGAARGAARDEQVQIAIRTIEKYT